MHINEVQDLPSAVAQLRRKFRTQNVGCTMIQNQFDVHEIADDNLWLYDASYTNPHSTQNS